MPTPEPVWLHLATALGIGLLIGAERERRKSESASHAPAGIRTFTIVSLLGAVSITLGGELLLAASVLGTAGFFGVAYWRAADDDPGLTTEMAVLLTLVLGALAMREPALAAALAVATAVLLSTREQLHHFVSAVLTENELSDLLVLAAATLVVLPLIPDRYLGPFAAINPHTLWIVVILVLSIGAAGHVALRALGPRLGLPITGLASGFVSSIATIAAMGERASLAPGLLRPAVAGAVLSTVATIIQLSVLIGATSPTTLMEMVIPLACAGTAAIAYGAFIMLAALREPSPEPPAESRAFSVRSALVLAAAIGAVLLIAAALNAWFGQAGLMVATGVAGFADTHAAAVSVASLVASGNLEPHDAAVPVLIAMSTNTVSKLIVAFTNGGRKFGLQVAPGLILVIGAAWLGWVVR